MPKDRKAKAHTYALEPEHKPAVVDRARTILRLAEGWSDFEAQSWLHERASAQQLNVEVIAGWIVAGATWPQVQVVSESELPPDVVEFRVSDVP